MKKNILKILLISILSVHSIQSYAIDCEILTFKRAASLRVLNENDFSFNNLFFIKGVALDVFEYGRYIKVIEDLKGNFADETNIFVWGAGSPSEESGFFRGFLTGRQDAITLYNENDTLIMLLHSPRTRPHPDCIETYYGGYGTLGCANAVLLYSTGYVTGHISAWEDRNRWWEGMSQEEFDALVEGLTEHEIRLLIMETMLWKNLKEQLFNPTSIPVVRTRNNIHQWDGTIFFENPGNNPVKLSFYDLSGRLVYEALTTSDSYSPGLSGNIFMCKIKINNEVQTIKYIAR